MLCGGFLCFFKELPVPGILKKKSESKNWSVPCTSKQQKQRTAGFEYFQNPQRTASFQ
jgi:hypothetical protein